jgi:hypothetical protein
MSESQIRIHNTGTTQNIPVNSVFQAKAITKKEMPFEKNARTKLKIVLKKVNFNRAVKSIYLRVEDEALPARTACKDVQKCTNSCHSPHLMILT